MTQEAVNPIPQVTIPPVEKSHGVLALGCWAFGGGGWGGQDDDLSRQAMQAAYGSGMNHFDTAMAYGGGRSERLVGAFIADKRDQVYLATKGNTPKATAQDIRDSLEESLENLQTDHVDLYYIHWPRAGKDMKPVLAEMEKARDEGKIRSIGVSNFSVEQMEDVSSVCRIDANQFCYNLYWRYPEDELMPYCREKGVAMVTYSSIAQGILTGKFGPNPTFPEGDGRRKMIMLQDNVWPKLYELTEQAKGIADEANQPLTHLAIQWVAAQPGVTSVLLGARNADQARENAAAMAEPAAPEALDRLTAIGDEARRLVPDVGNIFQYYP